MEPLGVAVVIPTLDEAGSIKGVVTEIPRDLAREIIVVDGGSRDGTAAIAESAGARVVASGAPGYGSACATGAVAASPDCDILVFMDGDGADRGDLMARLVEPMRSGGFDFVIASRALGGREPGSMSWHQLFAGYPAGIGTRALYGVRYTDMCAYRAIRRDCLERLGMREDDVRLEHRDADESRADGVAHRGGADAVSLPQRRQIEGRWHDPRLVAGRLADHRDLFTGCRVVPSAPSGRSADGPINPPLSGFFIDQAETGVAGERVTTPRAVVHGEDNNAAIVADGEFV
jgi:glycosyltransferase involved in cell wall biosynthesis